MTCCIGVVDNSNHFCYIGADSCVSSDSFYIKASTPKVFHANGRKDILWGCAGSIRMANLLSIDTKLFPENFNTESIYLGYVIEFVIPIIKEYAESLHSEHKEFDLILAVRDRLFRIQDDFSVYEVLGELITIGCGCSTAYGAMKAYSSIIDLGYEQPIPLRQRILHAIKISSEYDYGVSCPVKILNTSLDEEDYIC